MTTLAGLPRRLITEWICDVGVGLGSAVGDTSILRTYPEGLTCGPNQPVRHQRECPRFIYRVLVLSLGAGGLVSSDDWATVTKVVQQVVVAAFRVTVLSVQ